MITTLSLLLYLSVRDGGWCWISRTYLSGETPRRLSQGRTYPPLHGTGHLWAFEKPIPQCQAEGWTYWMVSEVFWGKEGTSSRDLRFGKKCLPLKWRIVLLRGMISYGWKYCQCIVIMWPESCIETINWKVIFSYVRVCVCVDTFDSKRRNWRVWLL